MMPRITLRETKDAFMLMHLALHARTHATRAGDDLVRIRDAAGVLGVPMQITDEAGNASNVNETIEDMYTLATYWDDMGKEFAAEGHRLANEQERGDLQDAFDQYGMPGVVKYEPKPREN